MALSRRRLLTLLGFASLGGCGSRVEQEPSTTSTSTTMSTPRSTGPPVPPQSITLGNSRSEPTFVTVVVERASETVFIESRELVPSERHRINGVLSTAGAYDVVVETADGDRDTYRWDVVDQLDGLSVHVADGIDFRRTSRCDGDCPLVRGGETLDTALIGDGTGRWYAPAQVVLVNPGAARTASLTVSLYGEQLVDARYRVARDAQVVIPLTYRSGRYDVTVERDGDRVTDDWRVPEEPSRTVDLSTLEVGCGRANTEFRVQNSDVRPHTVDVTVAREGTVRFSGRFDVEPGGRRATVPVTESGRYDVTLRLDDGVETRDTWWSCPPHGPATAVVDATGTVTLQQSGL